MSDRDHDVGQELVPVNGDVANREDRLRALEALSAAAESAEEPDEAQRLMNQAHTARVMLQRTRQPLDECWLAGKASVLAARRLGVMLGELSNVPTYLGIGKGSGLSEVGALCDELAIPYELKRQVIKLAKIPDPEFQRYIQNRNTVPSISGALIFAGLRRKSISEPVRRMNKQRRSHGVKIPRNPSLDAAYLLLVEALGHLEGVRSGGKKAHRITGLMYTLYEVEDELKPLRGGYVA